MSELIAEYKQFLETYLLVKEIAKLYKNPHFGKPSLVEKERKK